MHKYVKKALFPVFGIAALIWFLIRVIPKPSRAAYPCMRAAAPLASTFVIYITGFLTSIFFFKRAQKFWRQSRYVVFSLALLLAAFFSLTAFLQPDKPAFAYVETTPDGPNQPMGTGVGINPGRVVWVHNPDATDETCRNRRDDYWWQDDNTNQAVANKMVSEALRALTGTASDEAAWDAVFRNFNESHGKGNVGYAADEKIVIKINLNANGCSYNSNDYERWDKTPVDASPQIVYAVLDQLVNKAGVPQANIGFGDPGRNVDDLFWDHFHAQFPDVKYWGNGNGRTPIVRSQNYEMFTSDGSHPDWLPQCYLDAAYMINIPVLKKHHRAGISVCSKNHFGTFVPFQGSAMPWHFSLPASEGGADVNNGDYGLYRCFVDFMGHKHIGGKTILYLVDGLWGSTNWAHPPIKWGMAPFNNDWPSSILMSQDPVAVESVAFDFLFEEFDLDHPTEGAFDPSDNKGPFPHYAATDDFLHQAADSKNWPQGFTYDPENDGTPLPASMGAHEHWNNATEKKYTRNLGGATGIELVTPAAVGVEQSPVAVTDFVLAQNYPNPFNPTTTITYTLPAAAQVRLTIYNALGQQVKTLAEAFQQAGPCTVQWDGRLQNSQSAPSGVYLYELAVENDGHSFKASKKMALKR